MSAPVSRLAILLALLKKELLVFSRDKLYLFLTALTLVIVVVFYHLLPDTVDETITVGLSPSVQTLVEASAESLAALGVPEASIAELRDAPRLAEEQGLILTEFDTAEEMAAAIESGDEVQIGVAVPPDFVERVLAGERDIEVTVYSQAAVPDEVQAAMSGFIREIARQLAGEELPVRFPAEDLIILGPDRMGDQIPLRDRMLPMFALMILLMESFALASLISVEVLQRTASAVLVTPARVSDMLAAKTIFGSGLAFVQGMFVLLVLGAFTSANWLPLTLTMLIGALIFTSLAMVAGAAGKDFMGQVFYTMGFTVPLLIPAFAILFPGSAATWVTFLPTWPLLDVIVGVTVYDAVLADVWPSMLMALAWGLALYAVGLVVLRRKVHSL